MKSAALCIVCMTACATIAADAQQFRAGDDLVEFVRKNCGAGCVVFTAQEAKALNEGVNAIMLKNARSAFDAGKRASDETCRNKI